jgi:alpha-D-xyloside xylohydrolase
MDASEPDILSNVSPEKRKLQMTPTASGNAAEFLNAYPLQNAKGIYEGQRTSDSSKRVFLLTRSGFAGSQRYAAAIWSGDIGSTWHDMRNQISAGVNFSMSGIPYWTMDIGGFVRSLAHLLLYSVRMVSFLIVRFIILLLKIMRHTKVFSITIN